MVLAVRGVMIGAGLATAGACGLATLAQTPVAPSAPPASASTMSLTALKQLEPGLWQLDVKGRAPKQSCVTEPTALIQIEHEQPNCSRFVIANDPKSATVHYSCQRAGWGRTTVRVESPEAATIQTQGIAKNQPFDYSVQARRIGACDAVAAVKR